MHANKIRSSNVYSDINGLPMVTGLPVPLPKKRADRLSALFRAPVALLAIAAVVVLASMALRSRAWPTASTTVQAAVRFEVRLAEERPAAGLREAPVAGANRSAYLHEEVVVTNADIERSAVVPAGDASRFNIGIQFNAAGADKMQQATANRCRPTDRRVDRWRSRNGAGGQRSNRRVGVDHR